MNRFFLLPAALILCCAAQANQSPGNAGTITGTVTDPSGSLVPNATISLANPMTSYKSNAVSDANGAFRLISIPPNAYELTVSAAGFTASKQNVNVRSAVPMSLTIQLALGETVTSVDVEASGALVENEPTDHTDVDRSAILKLPTVNPGAGLSDAITYNTGGVTADANGMFHPEGDHAQNSYVVDGQQISDQQSKTFSTQLPTNAIQSMEIVTGSPGAEYGDKSSLVVNAVTRSGLGAAKAFGNLESDWSSFGTYGGNASLGFGTDKIGNFIAIDGVRTGRFLDTPAFLPIHAIGNNARIFDRLDYQPNGTDTFHLNLFTARNWFQVPNSYDQLAQDQRQRVLTWNVAPGYQHTFSAHTLLTTNLWARRDEIDYYGSRDQFNDTPVAATQNRFLTNYGVKADLSHVQGNQEVRVGVQIQQTRLIERFTLGVTDPLFNAPCVNSSGDALALPSITNPGACASVNSSYSANPQFSSGLLPYDLTRGGSDLLFHGKGNVNQYAFYVQDRITLGAWTINAGLRDDQYNGLSAANGIQPRVGISYLVKPTTTVLRVAYSRTFETPFNENLLLSSGTGLGGLTANGLGASPEALRPGSRNQFNAGFQQKLGRFIVVDADYFWKYTHNAFDFDVLFNTPITFPISWHNSKTDGVTARVSTTEWHGLQAYLTMGHTRARYFPPEVGGLIPQSALATSVFRIDHDQAFQQTTNIRYQRPSNGPYISFVWRYDSGMVAGAVPDVATALTFTGAEQAAMGFYCGGTFATVNSPITSCPTGGGSTLIRIPAVGKENDDSNPPRLAPRNVFDVAVGTDNLLRTKEKKRVTAELSLANLTNTVSLYNFLSTFSGTHFVEPRTWQMHLGYVF